MCLITRNWETTFTHLHFIPLPYVPRSYSIITFLNLFLTIHLPLQNIPLIGGREAVFGSTLVPSILCSQKHSNSQQTDARRTFLQFKLQGFEFAKDVFLKLPTTIGPVRRVLFCSVVEGTLCPRRFESSNRNQRRTHFQANPQKKIYCHPNWRKCQTWRKCYGFRFRPRFARKFLNIAIDTFLTISFMFRYQNF